MVVFCLRTHACHAGGFGDGQGNKVAVALGDDAVDDALRGGSDAGAGRGWRESINGNEVAHEFPGGC